MSYPVEIENPPQETSAQKEGRYAPVYVYTGPASGVRRSAVEFQSHLGTSIPNMIQI